jgi:acetolactate synthase-1/2/3 large subunit
VGRVAELVAAAQAPLVFAGGGCRGSADRVVALAEALDAPVVTSFNGKGVIPADHPLHAGSSEEEPAVRRLIESSDLCLALGTRFAEEYTCHWTVRFPSRLVQVDLNPERIGRNYPVAEGVVGDIGAFCDSLLAHRPSAGARDGGAEARAALAGRASEVAVHGFELERRLLAELQGALPEGAIVVSDMTIFGYWGVLYLDAARPGGFVYPMAGALGSGIPSALGAVAANPDVPTIVLIGDGGFLMGGHELATARQNGLNMVVLLVNDSSYGVLKNYQLAAYGRTTGVDLESPDFRLLAEGYGIRHQAISGDGDLAGALSEAYAALPGQTTLIELQTALGAPPQSI